MSLESISLRHLRHFLEVADKGSFARVAALLDVDQPTLSRSVKRIETGLGAMLFHRNGRGVTLTAHGERFLEEVRGFLGQIDELREQVNLDQLSPRGQVTFALVHHLSESFAPGLLMRFHAAYPEVQVHLIGGHSGTIQDLLVEGEVDIGILYDSGNIADLVVDRLREDSLYLFGSTESARKFGLGNEVPLELLASLPMVLPGRHHGLRRSVDNALSAAGLQPNVSFEVDILGTLRSLVLDQSLFTVLPLDAGFEVTGGRPYYLAPIVGPEVRTAIGLALARNRPISLATRTFSKFIRDEMKAYIRRQEQAVAQANLKLPYIASSARPLPMRKRVP